MDHVRVHYNSSQPAQLSALAYAQGSDIHLAQGQEQHLPHEVWHVVQQARVRPTAQIAGGMAVNDEPMLKREADLMGRRAAIFEQQTDQMHKPEHAQTPGEAALKAKTNTKHNFGTENTRSMNFVTQFTKRKHVNTNKASNKKAKAEEPKEPEELIVKNTKNDYTSGWRRNLSMPTGVEGAPKNEAKKLSRILEKPCVGGHMINDQMGGLGNFNNIIPITKSMNNKHKGIENKITQRFGGVGYRHIQYKYDMEVSDRITHEGPGGTVHNWPTTFKNSFEIREKDGAVVEKESKECKEDL